VRRRDEVLAVGRLDDRPRFMTAIRGVDEPLPDE
jgi:hypothetical protein